MEFQSYSQEEELSYPFPQSLVSVGELCYTFLVPHNTVLPPPDKSESVNTISQRSELVKSVSKQVRVYDEESHFETSSDYIKHLYSRVKESILSIGPDVSIRPMVKYISFVRKRNFVDIVVRKTNLTLFLNIKIGLLNDPKGIARDVSKVGHWGNGDYEVVVKNTSEMGYVNSLIRQSYENN